MQHEALLVLELLHGVDDLRVLAGSEGGGDKCLGLAAREERRAVGAGKDGDFGGDRTDLVEAAAVEASATLQDLPAKDVFAKLVVDRGHERLLGRLVLGNCGHIGLLDRVHFRVHLELVALLHRFVEWWLEGRRDLVSESVVDFLLWSRAFGLADLGHHLTLNRADDLDRLMPGHKGANHVVFSQFTRTRLDHADGLFGAGDEEVQLALRLHLGAGGIDMALPVPETDPDRAHWRVEGNVGDAERGRSADQGQGVRLVLEVGRPEKRADLGLTSPAFGEEGPHRTVDLAAGEDFLLVLPAFTLEEAARDLAGGEVVLSVVDGQGKEVDARLRLFGRTRGHENHRVPHAHHSGAVSLLGHAACFNSDRRSADLDLIPFHGHCAFLRAAWNCERMWDRGRSKTGDGPRSAVSGPMALRRTAFYRAQEFAEWLKRLVPRAFRRDGTAFPTTCAVRV